MPDWIGDQMAGVGPEAMRVFVFTGCLLEALRGRGGTGSDGLIRVFEVFDYVSENVSRTVPGHQHPIFKASNLEDNFPVALKWGGAKNVSGSTSGPRRSRSIEDIMSNLYPAGPLDQEIWARAGGDVSRLHLSGTGRATWYSALRTLGQGGGGADISTDSLVRAALDDFPHHPDLQALTTKSR
jgi:metacaspase-1